MIYFRVWVSGVLALLLSIFSKVIFRSAQISVACLCHQRPGFSFVSLWCSRKLSVNDSSVPSLPSMWISVVCPSPTNDHDFLRHFGFREFWLLSFGFLRNTFPAECMDLCPCPPRSRLRSAPDSGASTFLLPPCLQIPEVFLLWSFSSFAHC
jgi:hypothetical protein